MSVLLTGGLAAITSVYIASKLHQASIPFAIGSRRAPRSITPAESQFSNIPFPAIRFDYEDISTWDSVFASPPGGIEIAAVWLVVPEIEDPEAAMVQFVEYCFDKGVRRYVLCAETTTTLDHSVTGKMWRMLMEMNLDYVVLRPTWFMDNFSHGFHLETIKSESTIYTCAKKGRSPIVAAEDVAALAFHALTDAKVSNSDWKVYGPDLLSHDDIAAILSSTLGKEITHAKVSPGERQEILTKRLGLSPAYSRFIVLMENLTLEGQEDVSAEDHAETLGNFVRVVKKKPLGLREFVDEYRACWK
ncbi:nucleoside-diphosphate-sugar epimerase family protein [Zalerion maritima]|uniref:Nucleoside-diphosphate-sugar epimerase family protein n=1 Tax=Zalerion maritima TaxID=339359 RepID=A0AAD5RFW1_9PEZI|nr:nucleoside-diphosphate-sugar epimerase family protein [Zalerion maritima]